MSEALKAQGRAARKDERNDQNSQSCADQDNRGPLRGDYLEYGGTLDDVRPPTKDDSKLAIRVAGKLASEMFRHLGRAAGVQGCADAQETRARGDLICVSGGTGKGMECYIGLDVLKGRSMNGMIC